MPDLYISRENPDYIVLSDLWYHRFMGSDKADTEQARILRDLFEGRLGYTLVAEFKTPVVLPIEELFLNPRILIFKPI